MRMPARADKSVVRLMNKETCLKYLAAKSDSENEDRWLPLRMHSKDTAEVMRYLVLRWLPDATRKHFRMQEDMLVEVAMFLGWMHDAGKATVLFQSRILQCIPTARSRVEKYVRLRQNLRGLPSYSHARASEAILLSLGCPAGIASVAGAHHGRPQSSEDGIFMDEQMDEFPDLYWAGGEEKTWRDVWCELLQRALAAGGLTSVQQLSVLSIPEELLLTGLLTMADWIASNTEYFPLIDADQMDGRELYPARVEQALAELRLTAPWESECPHMDERDFFARFGFAPNAVQKAVTGVAASMAAPGIIVLEAQMGVGKTEEALAAAEELAGRFGFGGVYFGLPTQATANGIFGRLKAWAQTQSEETAHSLRLAHGAAELNDEYRSMFSGSAHTEEDGDAESGVLVHQWFQGNKQSLLADFVIATVDQLLMAALRQKHLMLRHLGLAGKVVIVDECHAYDTYMNCYLERALAWLGTYGVPVILLSATLPAERRAALVQAYLGTTMPDAPWKQSCGYPLVTWTDGGEVRQRTIPGTAEKRTVEMQRITDQTLCDFLKNRLVQGGCAGVIVNTVKKAQGLAEQIRQNVPGADVLLVHAQYIQPDRAAKEKTLLERLGKGSGRPQRDHLIVVGTQVIEQSLDIDFDLLVSELCPMDLLLQRIGRLHRHDRDDRPGILKKACCALLDTGTDAYDPGSTAIYGEWLLWKTRQLLPPTVTLPDDISPLVQKAYAQMDAGPVSDPRWDAYRLQEAKKAQRARAYVILPPEKHERMPQRDVLDDWMRDTGARTDASARMAVRDGDPSLDVLVMVQQADGAITFLPWQEKGREVPADCVPSAQTSQKIARQKLRLPGWFSRRWNIERVVRELEEQNRALLSAWQQAPLLKGELVLLLRSDFTAELAGMTIKYDRENGLTYQKGGEI